MLWWAAYTLDRGLTYQSLSTILLPIHSYLLPISLHTKLSLQVLVSAMLR
jgi:hypothetical protein